MQNGQARILVVDDQVDIRTSLAEVLSSLGHNVRTAEDGFLALDAFRREIPDILLSDLNMPRMSGFELLSVVRRRFPAVQVIAMSGAFSGTCVPEGVAADAFYEKGTGLRSLLDLMERTARSERLSLIRHSNAPAPIWIDCNGRGPSEGPWITITCPECMRTFPQLLEEEARLIRDTECVFCRNSIAYSVVGFMEQAASA